MSALFSVSAYIGIASGMKRLEAMVWLGVHSRAAAVLLVANPFFWQQYRERPGPDAENYVRMSLFQ